MLPKIEVIHTMQCKQFRTNSLEKLNENIRYRKINISIIQLILNRQYMRNKIKICLKKQKQHHGVKIDGL